MPDLILPPTKLIFPDGRKPGCLPRVSHYGTVCDKLEDRIDVIPQEQWDDYIGKVDLRPCVDHIFNQRKSGSCATESTTQGLAICRAWGNQSFVLLNPWSIYYFTKIGYDGGSNIDTNLRHIRDVGVLPMALWPRSKGWRTKPPQDLLDTVACNYRIDEFFDIATVDEVGTALIKGLAVVFGWQGHSCVLTKLLSRTIAEYANSWEESWGDKGFGRIRLSSINFGYGAFAVSTALDSGPSEN